MNLLKAIQILKKGMLKIDKRFEITSLYCLLSELETTYKDTDAGNLNKIDVSDLIQKMTCYHDIRNNKAFIGGEFEKEIENDLKILNGWIAICEDSSDVFDNFKDDNDIIQYSLDVMKLFVYEAERHDDYKKYTKIGNERKYIYFTPKSKP